MRAGAETTLACSPEPNPLRAKAKRNVLPTPQKPANRRRCAQKLRRTERAAHRNRDEPSVMRAEMTTKRIAHPSEARGTKKRYLSELCSLHLQPACPTS